MLHERCMREPSERPQDFIAKSCSVGYQLDGRGLPSLVKVLDGPGPDDGLREPNAARTVQPGIGQHSLMRLLRPLGVARCDADSLKLPTTSARSITP